MAPAMLAIEKWVAPIAKGADCERCHAPIQDDNPKEWVSWIKFVIRLNVFLPVRPGFLGANRWLPRC